MFPISTLRTAYAQSSTTQSLVLLPLAGGLMGLAGLGAYWVGTVLFPPPYLPVLLSIATVAGLTQAQPERGFAVVISRSGNDQPANPPALTSGLVWPIVLLAARIFALQALFGNEAFGPIVMLKYVMAHSLSHLMATSLSWSVASANHSAPTVSTGARLVATLTGLVPLLALVWLTTLWIYALFLIPLLLLRAWLVSRCRRDANGDTGSYLGATQQLSELVVYLSFVSLLWISV